MSKKFEKPEIFKNDLRTFAGLAMAFISLVAFLMLTACAPKPVERVYPEPKTDFGPMLKDPTLQVDQVRSTSINSSLLKWNETVDSARIFRFAEAMIDLGQSKNSPALTALGKKIGETFYRAKGTATHAGLTRSLYADAAVGETKDEVMPLLDSNDQMLVKQLALVKTLLQQTTSSFPWPAADASPVDALAAGRFYVQQFLDRALVNGIDHDVYDGLVEAFNTDFYPLIDGLSADINSILAEKSSITMIDRLKVVVKKYDFKLDPNTQAMLDQARGVFVDIDGIESDQEALRVIVELWEMTAESSRQKVFEPVSHDLYGFLKGKSHSELKCLANDDCLNPLISVPKHVAILPAINKYGVDKLRDDVGKAAHDTLVKQISAAVVGFVPGIPDEIDQKVTAQLTDIRKKIAQIKTDYPSFIRDIVHQYETQNLGIGTEDDARIYGLESIRVSINLSPGSVAVSQNEKSSSSASGSEVLGDSFAYAAALWGTLDTTSLSFQRSVLSQITKLLTLGGFKTPNDKPYPSLAVSIDPATVGRHMNIHKDFSSDTSFAVPDRFTFAADLSPTIAAAGPNVSVRGQAELLRGLAAMVRYFRDWEKNGYDTSMGAVQVGKLINDLPAGSVTSRLFPKDSFFALSLGNSATILLNMTKQLTPVFLIDITKKTKWSNNRNDEADQPSTMAGIVDIVNGQRTNIVRTADAARFLIAVMDFIDATDGIENTKSEQLIKMGDDGKRPIDQLLTARTSLTELAVGLGNFIAHEMQLPDGGIRATFRRDLVAPVADEPRSAIDQAVCILAMVRAGEFLKKEIFVWPALDAYVFMNKTLYDGKRGFYRASEDSQNLPPVDEIVTILQAGDALRSHMSVASRDQWDMISAPWLKALEGLNSP